ncbi:MAG: BtrH N-terminal domain-containing protein [Proteobacteria bacterium]|nr:BtrH N-terminal domain-containing protein [Pseudomonadota bacterium]
MTRAKDLKRRVRTRMTKTGERYTTARAHVLARSATSPTAGRTKSKPARPVAQHGETYALSGFLAAAGVVDPGTGEPFAEAMLLGIGGGLGAAYFVFEYKGHPPHLYIGTRVGHQYPYTADFATAVCSRLGVEIRVHEIGSKKTASKHLVRATDGGRAALVWTDMGSLSYWQIDEAQKGALPHVVLVTRIDQEANNAAVIDHSARPFSLPLGELVEARARLRKAKNRVIEIIPKQQVDDLCPAVHNGLVACVNSLRDGALVASAAGNFGLSALDKWAHLVNNPRDKKGWPRAFRPGIPLYTGLRQTYFWIEMAGTGGGAFRPMYADFLDRAAQLLDRPTLGDLAGEYRSLGDAWTELAEAALPETVSILAETRALLRQKHDAVRRRDSGWMQIIGTANQRLDQIEKQVESEFPLDDASINDLYADLERRLRDVTRRERDAVDRLAHAIG